MKGVHVVSVVSWTSDMFYMSYTIALLDKPYPAKSKLLLTYQQVFSPLDGIDTDGTIVTGVLTNDISTTDIIGRQTEIASPMTSIGKLLIN
eukprot:12494764-Ditylum_brightwellii.AAC.1